MKPELTVVKIGGKVLDDQVQLGKLLDLFVQIPGFKILVHGGGKTATDIANKLGVSAPMINGRRITSPEMLDVAVMVYGGLMSRQIVAQLQARGQNALGMTGADLDVIRAQKRPVKDIDYGLAGDIVGVNPDSLDILIRQDIVPVLAPLTHDGQGQLLNTNADTIAATIAGSLGKNFHVNLVYCFEKPGVMIDPDDPQTVIPQLDYAGYQNYLEQGIIAAGMIPKLKNAFEALNGGVGKVYICQAEAIAKIGQRDFIGTRIEIRANNV